MKKTRHIELVLITAALASCNQPRAARETGNRVYLRSDTSAPYTRVHHHGGTALWYYAFRPYGSYQYGMYTRAGYYSGAIHERSNLGTNGFKGGIVRGGFGRSSYSVSS